MCAALARHLGLAGWGLVVGERRGPGSAPLQWATSHPSSLAGGPSVHLLTPTLFLGAEPKDVEKFGILLFSPRCRR